MNEDDDRRATEFVRIVEIHRTIRTIAICVVVAIGIVAVCWAAVRITEKPPWLVLLLAILAPGGVVYSIIRTFRWYIKRTNQRVVDLEKRLDSDRTSSGLDKNGTTPHGV